jgi:hypothetical protein
VELSDTDKQAILKNQENKCALCDAEEALEFDHIVPLSAGSDSNFDSYQGLCVACHKSKTAAERHVYGSAWSSRLSRDVLEGLTTAPPPRQQVWGDGGSGYELDVVQCRPFALQKAARLPIADILDCLEVWAEWMPWDGIDFLFVDAGPCSDQQIFYSAYGGPQWLARDMVKHLLEHKIESSSGLITSRDFGACFRASRFIKGEEVEKAFDKMREAIDLGLQTTGNFERSYAEKFPK